MPIYEYRCAACGFQKEYLQKMSDAPPTECPECGKPSLAKMVTAAGFQLKGSGWYATDFKTAAKPKVNAESEGKDAAKSEDKSAVKAEDKPAATKESKSAPEAAATKSDSTKSDGTKSDSTKSDATKTGTTGGAGARST